MPIIAIKEKTSKYRDSSEYRAWINMKYRCSNKVHPQYKDYGGRGINVCDEWINSFLTFIKDMGKKPTPKHTLDRKDNDGNYEPKNCRWATMKEQIHNRRSSEWEHRKVLIKKRYMNLERGIFFSAYHSRWIVKVMTKQGQKQLARTKTRNEAVKILRDYARSM